MFTMQLTIFMMHLATHFLQALGVKTVMDSKVSTCPHAGGCPFPSTWIQGGIYDGKYCTPAPIWTSTQDTRPAGGVNNYDWCFQQCNANSTCAGVTYKNGGQQWCYFCNMGGAFALTSDALVTQQFGSGFNIAFKPCAQNFYRSQKTSQCTQCGTCLGSQFERVACATSRDTECGECSVLYRETGGTCTACTGNECTAWSCAAGYFHETGKGCTQCKTCGAGTFQQQACGTSSNTVCVDCSARHPIAGGQCTHCTDATCGGVTCKADYALSGNGLTCLPTNPASCMARYAIASGECTSCSGVACTGATCDVGYYLTSGMACASCDQHSVVNGTCTSCTAESCSQVDCQPGFYANGIECRVCSACTVTQDRDTWPYTWTSLKYTQTSCTNTRDTVCADYESAQVTQDWYQYSGLSQPNGRAYSTRYGFRCAQPTSTNSHQVASVTACKAAVGGTNAFSYREGTCVDCGFPYKCYDYPQKASGWTYYAGVIPYSGLACF